MIPVPVIAGLFFPNFIGIVTSGVASVFEGAYNEISSAVESIGKIPSYADNFDNNQFSLF